MSRAYQSFEYGIKDAEELLAHFDAINTNPPPANAEVLKRAGLVMALTAWETYVEDRLLEEMNKKLGVVAGSYVGDFVLKKTEDAPYGPVLEYMNAYEVKLEQEIIRYSAAFR